MTTPEPSTEDAPDARGERLLIALLFLSGFAGISYEVLYARLLGNLVGNHFAVNSAILITFLTGVALGTRYAYRLAAMLWLIEIGIGAYALGLVAGVSRAGQSLGELTAGGSHLRPVVAVFALLIVPAALIGMSLPLFAAAIRTRARGRSFALAYSIYNIGAAATAFAAEFLLIRQAGITAAVILVGLINLLVGVALRVRRLSPHVPATAAASAPVRQTGATVIAVVLISFASAVFQLFVLKASEFVFGPFNETFALVLTAVLGGIAVGSWAVRRIGLGLGPLIAVAAVWLIGLTAMFEGLLLLYAEAMERLDGPGVVAIKLALVVAAFGVPFACFGAAIPAVMTTERHVALESGRLLFVSSLANVAGYLAMVFVIHERLDYHLILVLISATLGLAWCARHWRRPRRMALALPVLAAQLLVATTVWNPNALYGSHVDFSSRGTFERRLERLETADRYRKYDEVVAIETIDGRRHFFMNGYYSIPLDRPDEQIVGVLSTMTAPRLDRALVLGLGTGQTAGVVAHFASRTDVVEISPLIIEHQDELARYSYDVASNPSATIHCDDAIRFLRRGDRPYDLIVNTVTSPRYFSSSKLYTADFLAMVKSRLTKDGVYTTWIDRELGDRGMAIVLRTLDGAFEQCAAAVISSSYQLLVCSDRDIRIRAGELVEADPAVGRYLAEMGTDLESVRFAFVTPDALDALSAMPPASANTLDWPVLEFEMARGARRRETDIDLFKRWTDESYDLDRLNETIHRNATATWVDVASYARFTSDDVLDAVLEDTGLDDRTSSTTLARRISQRWLALYERFPSDAVWKRGAENVERVSAPAAVGFMHEVVRQRPEPADAQLVLAGALFGADLHAEALDALNAYVAQRDVDLDALFEQGNALSKAGLPEAALIVHERLAEVDPAYAGVNKAICRIEMRLGRYERARIAIERELRHHADDRDAQVLLGILSR